MVSVFFLAAANSFAQYRITYSVTSGPTISQVVSFSCIIKYNSSSLMVAGRADNYIILLQIQTSSGAVLARRLVELAGAQSAPEVKDMILDSDGDLVLCGFLDPTHGNDNSDERAFVMRYDFTNSNVVWATLDNSHNVLFLDLLEEGTGGDFLVCGEYDDVGSLAQDAVIYRAARSNGVLTSVQRDRWTNTVNAGSSDTYNAMFRNSNNLFLTGRFEHDGDAKMRPLLVRCNQNGTNCDALDYYLKDISGSARLYSIDMVSMTEAGTGYFYIPVYGNLSGTSPTTQDLTMVKTDMSGNLTWAYKYDVNAGSNNDGVLHQVQPYSPTHLVHNVVLLGSLYDATYTDNSLGDIFLLELNSSGTVLWGRQYAMRLAHPLNTGSRGMLVLAGKIYVVGEEDAVITDGDAIPEGVLLCVDASNGNMGTNNINPDCLDTLITQRTTLSFDDTTTIIQSTFNLTLSTPTDSTYVITTSIATSCILARFGNDGDILNVGLSEIPVAIYPNPSSEYFTVSFLNDDDVPATIELYDMYGRRVMQQDLSSDEITVSRKGCENGIYFYKIKNDERIIDEGRIVLQ